MQNKKQSDSINLLDLFFYLLSKWKWFFLYAIIGVLVAYAIYSATSFTYFCSATIAIKDPANKAVSASLNRYDNLINKVNVTNEIYRFRSHKLMKEVVKRTNTAVSYKQPNRLRYLELYTQAPVTVTFPEDFAERYMSFYITPLGQNKLLISGVNGGEKTYDVSFGDTISLAGTKMVITPTNYLDESWLGKSLLIEKKSVSAMASYFISNLGIKQESEEASILKLSIQDASPVRAAEVLNTLISTYNEDVIKEKNQILDEISKSDELTQIYNRRGFLTMASRKISHIANKGKKAFVIYADMNNLKIINDRFGHEEGDYSLKLIAEILKESLDEDSIIGRFGGDEFAAFSYVPEGKAARSIRKTISDITKKKNEGNGKPYYVSMSVGICEFECGRDIDMNDLMDKADVDLYIEKKHKRSNVLKNENEAI